MTQHRICLDVQIADPEPLFNAAHQVAIAAGETAEAAAKRLRHETDGVNEEACLKVLYQLEHIDGVCVSNFEHDWVW